MIKKIMNFGIVGIIVVLFDMALLHVFTKYLNMNPVIATPLAYSIAFVLNFFASMKYVFKAKEGLSRGKQMLLFAGTAFVGMVINTIVMYIGTDLLHYNNVLVIKVVGILTVMGFNFISRYKLLDKGEEA